MFIEDGAGEPSTADMIADVTAPSGDEGGDSGGGEVVTADPAAAKPPADPQKYTYKVNGKEISEDLETILGRAGQGYHYAQRAEELNAREAQMKEQFGEHDPQRLMQFSKFDEYAKQNPDWWNHVNQSWEQREATIAPDAINQLDPDNELSPVVKGLHEQIQGLSEQLSTVLKSNQQAQEFIANEQRSRQDSALDTEIQTVGKKYGVDLTESDTQGQTLEFRVLKHAEALGLDGNKQGHFEAAFKDLHFNDLVQKQIDERLKTNAKETQKARKAGIIGTSSTPTLNGGDPFNGNVRAASYDDIGELVKQNLGNLDQLISRKYFLPKLFGPCASNGALQTALIAGKSLADNQQRSPLIGNVQRLSRKRVGSSDSKRAATFGVGDIVYSYR
jgi:hypothetical protein